MADFKQLCSGLMDALDSGIPGTRIQSSPLGQRARAALARFKPERLTGVIMVSTPDEVDRRFQMQGLEGQADG